MQKRTVDPSQVVALKDYPLHNEQILKIYFHIFQQGQGAILPPCPVTHTRSGIPYLHGNSRKATTYNAALDAFFKDHPDAEYFLLDGNHKSVAAALSHQPMHVLVMRTKKDFQISKRMVESGEIFGWYAIQKSVEEELQELQKHFLKYFSQKPHFYTVDEKAAMLAEKNDIPQYMKTRYATRK